MTWIDSGSSSRGHRAAQRNRRQGQTVPSRHVSRRFRTSIAAGFSRRCYLSLAGNGAAPFKTVLTHGFMVDADREKISKSKQGGYEKPQTAEAYVKKYGADVVRLWSRRRISAATSSSARNASTKLANLSRHPSALRYQLSNLYDFDPAKHTVAEDQLTGLGPLDSRRVRQDRSRSHRGHDKSEFHVVYQNSASSSRWSCPRSITTSSKGPHIHRRGVFTAPPLDADGAISAGKRA